jgi:hypothetical protein
VDRLVRFPRMAVFRMNCALQVPFRMATAIATRQPVPGYGKILPVSKGWSQHLPGEQGYAGCRRYPKGRDWRGCSRRARNSR